MPNSERSNKKITEPDSGERFTRLIIAHRPRIFGFIFSLVHDRDAAEDILQDVSVVMWRKFDQFEEGTNFSAWALQIARFSVLEWRRKVAKLPLPLDIETEAALAARSAEMAEGYDDMREVLSDCLRQLSTRHRDLIRARYFDGEPVQSIAVRLKRTRMAIYKALKKAHETLLDCMESKNVTSLGRGGHG